MHDCKTIEPGYIYWNEHGHERLRRIYSDDDTGEIFLEVITPACFNYEPFEGICKSECTWCDNPYHCKYNNVPRETFCTRDQLISWLFNEWLYFEHDCSHCNNQCEFNTRCNMYRVAIECMKRGDY